MLVTREELVEPGEEDVLVMSREISPVNASLAIVVLGRLRVCWLWGEFGSPGVVRVGQIQLTAGVRGPLVADVACALCSLVLDGDDGAHGDGERARCDRRVFASPHHGLDRASQYNRRHVARQAAHSAAHVHSQTRRLSTTAKSDYGAWKPNSGARFTRRALPKGSHTTS